MNPAENKKDIRSDITTMLKEHEKELKPHVGKDAEVYFGENVNFSFKGILIRIPKNHDNHESDLEFGVSCHVPKIGKSEDGRYGSFYTYFKLKPETIRYAGTVLDSDRIKIIAADKEFLNKTGTIFCADSADRIRHFGYDMFKA